MWHHRVNSVLSNDGGMLVECPAAEAAVPSLIPNADEEYSVPQDGICLFRSSCIATESVLDGFDKLLSIALSTI